MLIAGTGITACRSDSENVRRNGNEKRISSLAGQRRDVTEDFGRVAQPCSTEFWTGKLQKTEKQSRRFWGPRTKIP